MTSASGTCSQPLTATEGSASGGQQIYHSHLYGMQYSHHVEAESEPITIQGLTSGHVQPLDFCVPVTRSHPGDEDQRFKALHEEFGRNLAVEHIDISTAWNGLSDEDANELFRVHRIFVSTLEKMLANELWRIHRQLHQQVSVGNDRPIHTLFSAGIVRGISFCRDQLVSEMAEALYPSEENTVKAKSGFLRLYLIANDALVQHNEVGLRDTSITIRVRCDPSSTRPHPVVDAAWVPDSLMFEGLDAFPLEGHKFSIVPRYYSKSAFRPTHFPENVKYSIESESRQSPLTWLVWDDEIAGFRGIMPCYSEDDGYDIPLANSCPESCKKISKTLRIIVQAVLIDNSSHIRYERILRARLVIKVVPWYASDKERSSVPKTYQDKRLASAAQIFDLRGPRGRMSGQSSSRLSHRRKEAPLYTPDDHAHIGQVGFKGNHSVMGYCATGPGLGVTDMPSLAQTQAYLLAKCAELTRELEIVKEQAMVSRPSDMRRNRTLHVPDPQEHLRYIYRDPDHQIGHNRPLSGPSVPCSSHHASERLTAPSSPFLHGKNATFQLRPTARFSVLPPPAISPRTRPTLNLQTFNDGNTLHPTLTCWDLTPRPSTTSQSSIPEENSVTQEPHSTNKSDDLWRFPERATIPVNDTVTAQSSAREHLEALLTPPMSEGEPAPLSTCRKRGRKRRARSSPNQWSPLKRSKEIVAYSTDSAEDTLAFSNFEDTDPTQRSGGIFYNSFGPLHDLGSPIPSNSGDTLASHASEREASTKFGKNKKHRHRDSASCTDSVNTDSEKVVDKTSVASYGSEDGATTAQGFPSNPFFPDWQGQVCLHESSPVFFRPRHSSTSSTAASYSTSSELEIIVEPDLRARKVSRREQAKLWRLLSQSSSDKENQPGPKSEEVRLSEDEKKAMDEAMQRSLDDLAGGFDDIFLESSSESTSGDDL